MARKPNPGETVDYKLWCSADVDLWRTILASTAVFSCPSPPHKALVHLVLHAVQSLARVSYESFGRLLASMSLLTTTLKRSLGRPTGLLPCTSSPYKGFLGMQPSSILFWIWPIQRRHLWCRRGCLLPVGPAGRSSRWRECAVSMQVGNVQAFLLS